jgi:GntR family transcriptional repressor for pyruvate dehydrogenase complex
MTRTTLARIKHRGVKQQVFNQLRDQIVSGAWLPGSKIPSENELTRKLGVSRVSLREALHMLASLGLVEARQGGGTFVREYSGEVLFNPLFPMIALDRREILDVLEYRLLVEKGTAALAARNAGEKEIRELEEAYREMIRVRETVHAFARADLDFHLALARATGNPIVIKVNNVIRSILSASMDRIVGSLGVRDGLAYHRRILNAVKARKSGLAETLMEEHLRRTIRRLKGKKRDSHASKTGKP